MILYTLQDNGYIDFSEKIKMYPTEKFNMYVNITNRCNCNCTFCLRHLKEDHKLWLKDGEPSVEEIKQAFLNAPMDNVKEIVICGFGEPTIRLDDLIKVLKFIREKYPQMKVRMNTNGLSDLEFGKSTALMFEGLLDTISISLNESTAQKYLDVTRSRFGIKSYNAMLEFASQCKKYIPNVVVTIVDIIGEAEIAACKKVCEQYGLNLRIRKYEKN
ncbi:TatD family nuclease-associated radical SAM protein [Megamonas hypermegale]|uniref:TatD family nuclease-associated radical SAM protein n=1 Tax=Megamonas hypermegale TaxID=158847 RepID=UPI00255CCF0C|nr:TatD family nuclease-associated radical SAM protein [Megamonas hypermegale]